MATENQDPLFNIKTPDDTPARSLSPSEEFALAHPEFIQSQAPDREIDPNSRRATQLESAGGGIAAALRGQLSGQNIDETPVVVTKSVPVDSPKNRSRTNVKESRFGDQERDTSETPIYFDEPQLPTDTEKSTGLDAIQRIREERKA